MHRRTFVTGVAVSALGKGTAALAQVSPPYGVNVAPPRSAPSLRPSAGKWFFDLPRASFGKAKIGDDVYVVGGHTGGFHCYPATRFTDQVLVYNVKTQAWREVASYPFPVQGLQLVATDNSLYAFGGYCYDRSFEFVGCNVDNSGKTDQEKDTYSARSDDRVYKFDLTTDKWEPQRVLPHRRSSGSGFKVGNFIYLVAGWDGTPLVRGDRRGRFHSGVDAFDIQVGTYLPYDAKLQPSLRRALAAAEWNGKLVLAGGLTDQGQAIADVTVFDPASKQFLDEVIPALPEDRFAPGACFTGKWLVVAGGLSFTKGLLDIVVYCEPGKSSWQTLKSSPLSKPSMFVELTAIDDETVLALGAFDDAMPFPLVQTIKLP